MFGQYDVIVVGAGHSGCEAAAAAARLGSSVLLITMNMSNMAQMSCNPAMGGIAKGQIVREIDALGGLSGIVTDKTMIQFRMLNKSKGPAMWSPRAQSDRMLFSMEWRNQLEQIPGLDFLQDMVASLIIENGKVVGVKTAMDHRIDARAVILTNGTFLNGIIHIGEKKISGGRMGEIASMGITESLVDLGFSADRMKTGTPVRIDGRTIDFTKLEEQPGDETPSKFSFTDTPVLKKQRSCYLAYTNKKVHDALRTGFQFSPMFTGRIEGVGPRYCPSIEDKIDRFAGKDKHQLFVEPEGWTTIEYYLNGFSSSLPEEVQYKALRLIPGFEQVRVFRPGYAIEYDYFPPEQLKYSLETKLVEHLYFAGQINGTTGYEEAAAQGLIAGINAHRKLNKDEDFILGRAEAYIGVLVDDLITKGVDEPYRMFTSRAEYRILLRQDNADLRLTPRGHEIGLADQSRLDKVLHKEELLTQIIRFCKKESASPEEVNHILAEKGTDALKQKVKVGSLLLRPQLHFRDLIRGIESLSGFIGSLDGINDEIIEQAEIRIKYQGYIDKERDLANRLGKLENLVIKDDIDYQQLTSLSFEAREKLNKIRPRTIGQAARISGVSPADISVLAIYLGS
ncbi:MAG: tRNA uridine-5-carboxymethylaminomethyl(34) synthesis enzyme MnmG [Bacteroidetes bacterium]|nr:MAG: tRNA uridine-5-carboxymethylaminomethyl(34) synthesis enzyme MnmG [Bacteroidota bacterium]